MMYKVRLRCHNCLGDFISEVEYEKSVRTIPCQFCGLKECFAMEFMGQPRRLFSDETKEQ